MPNAGELTPEGRIMALLVGPKHSGKTVAACSFKEDPKKRTFDFDFDGRIRGILGAPWIDKSRIDYQYYPPRVGSNQKHLYEKINDDCEVMMVNYSMGRCPYETIIADSLTAETFGLLVDSIPLTHAKKTESGAERQVGKRIGTMMMAGPEDYGFEATGTYNFLAFIRSFPAKYVMVTAHTVDKYGKADPNDPYSESIITGEKLSLRDKIGTNIGIYFDHVFRFDRRMVGNEERYFVRFRSSIACTSFAQLPNGEIDITGKDFHEVLKGYLNKKE